AHAALRKDLRDLEGEALGPSGAEPAKMHPRLTRTRAHLAEHFKLEEKDGYMGAVLASAPHRARVVEHLRGEHQRLMAALDALLDQAAAAHGPDEALRAKVLAWVETVRDHESREDALVQDTFNVELSADD